VWYEVLHFLTEKRAVISGQILKIGVIVGYKSLYTDVLRS